jgi:hypothetical protein
VSATDEPSILPPPDAAARETQIRARVAALASFYRGLVAYLVAVPVMLAVNFWWVPQSGYWSLLVAAIWGTILAVEAVQIFWLRGWLSGGWEARKIEELMRDQQEQQGRGR